MGVGGKAAYARENVMSVYFWGVLTAQGLHDLFPCLLIVVPASVAVELLVVLDERLCESLLASPVVVAIVLESPDLGHVELDKLIHDVQLVKAIGDFQSLVDGLDVEGEVVCFKNSARLEPLGDTGLVFAVTAGVPALGDPTESAGSERVVKSVVGEGGLVGVVITTVVGRLCSRRIEGMSVDAARASRQASALGPLVAGVRGLGEVAGALGANTTHDGSWCT
jgi:hypothetical protein